MHATLTALYAEKNLVRVVDSMLTKYEVTNTKGGDRGVGLIEGGLATYRPAWRDKLSSDPRGWKSAYELMVKAKIIEPIATPQFYIDGIRQRALG